MDDTWNFRTLLFGCICLLLKFTGMRLRPFFRFEEIRYGTCPE
jgi:hypothetical protein